MSDSTIHARFTVTTKIAKAIDNDATRWAFRNVLATPADNGVFLTASDGKQVSVAHCEGETDAVYMVPQQAMPTANGGGDCELNGNWKTTTGKRIKKHTLTDPREAIDGKFPKVPEVFPECSPSTHEVLSIDVDLLKKLADSIEAEGEPVSLFIPKAVDGSIDAPIVALGGTGFGVIMPCTTGSEKDRAGKFLDFRRRHAEYSRHFQQSPSQEFYTK